jgi:hypothetical protein
MKTEHSTKITAAVKLLTEVQTECNELADMDDAEELHGQEVEGDERDIADQLEDIIDSLHSLG